MAKSFNSNEPAVVGNSSQLTEEKIDLKICSNIKKIHKFLAFCKSRMLENLLNTCTYKDKENFKKGQFLFFYVLYMYLRPSFAKQYYYNYRIYCYW